MTVCGCLRALLRLPVECRIAHAQFPRDQHTVGGNLVAALQNDMVADHDLIHRQNEKPAVTADLRRVLCRTRTQDAVLRIARDIRPRRDRRNDDDGHDRPHRLVDLRVSCKVHGNHERDHGEQDADHRIAKRLHERLPERRPRRLRNRVRAVFRA